MIIFWCVNVINKYNRQRACGYALLVYMYLFYLLKLSNFVQIRKITSIESRPPYPKYNIYSFSLHKYLFNVCVCPSIFHVKTALLNQTSDENETGYAYWYVFVYEYPSFFVVCIPYRGTSYFSKRWANIFFPVYSYA